ncbi:MAG: hypothetical protein NTW07_03815, partial [candidate division Zixibacteria bacterium]|nr:hypothetical protein [candidate division Zixibacteria bacterium]
MIRYGILSGLAIFIVSLVACGGGSQNPTNGSLAQYFPDRNNDEGLVKGSEIRTFVGDSLWEYIDGGAELYHTYGFVKVSTADYKSAQVELVLDLYEFKTPDGAYGFYSMLRPDQPDIVRLGVEGFFSGSSLDFVRGNILARVIGFDETPPTGEAIRSLASQVASLLPGSTERPAMFGLFPQGNVIANTDKMIGAAFLGQAFLKNVYTRDFAISGDTITLFVLNDPDGAAFAEWSSVVSEKERSLVSLTDMPFDEGHSLLIANPYYGDILAGL